MIKHANGNNKVTDDDDDDDDDDDELGLKHRIKKSNDDLDDQNGQKL